MRQLFKRKPIADLMVGELETPQSLRRVLSAGDLIMLAIGAVIGAGIFGASARPPPGKPMRPGT
jgi:APA family basic amino acid/polyamine antiporter